MFICNCEITSCHGLQPLEVSTTIPIVRAQAVTSCQCQKWWLRKHKKGCLQPFARLIPPVLPPQKHTQAGDCGTGGLFAPLRHLRTTVTSGLQPNTWDRVLLISVSLLYKYLFTPLTLPEESFHHWPLISAASPGGCCLISASWLHLGHFWAATWKKVCTNIYSPWAEGWKAASASFVSEITEFVSISTIQYKNSGIDEESAETPAWNVHFVPYLIQSVHSYWLPTLILSNLQWGLLPYWPYMTQSSHLSFSHQKKKILVNNPLQVDKIKFLLFSLMTSVTVIIYVM